MMIFIYGENTYLSQKKVEEMKTHFRAKFDPSGMNLVEFPIPGSKLEIGSVMQAVQSPPFLTEKRMVVVKDLASSLTKPLAKPWVEALQKVPESTIVVFHDTESVKKFEKRELFKQFVGNDGSHAYPFPAVTNVGSWAREEAGRIGLSIDGSLLNQVVAMVGSDQWQLSNELKKLAGYANGTAVTQEMVGDLVKANFEDQIFQFIDAVSTKNTREALKLLEAQREAGSTDFHLFSMLARQVRILLGARNVLDANPSATKKDVADALGVHPFVAQKSLSHAKRFSMPALKGLHTMLYKFDRALKRGMIASDVAVDRFVAQMLA